MPNSPNSVLGMPSLAVDVSVVVPVYMGKQWLRTCLDSLSKQTLDYSRFEVIFVFNGPDDGSVSLAASFAESHTSMNIRMLHAEKSSASHARNMGTEAASGKYLTWLDCDDWISPDYIELLLFSARSGIIPLAQIVDVHENGHIDDKSLINSSMMELEEHIVSPADYPRGLSFMTCKLIPRWMAKSVRFDETLRSGEDVVLYAEMFSKYDFDFSLLPAWSGAKYYRLIRNSSVSRQEPSFDFLVTQRLAVVAALDSLLRTSRPEALPLVKSFINSQASFVKRYVRDHQDQSALIADRIACMHLSYFPSGNWFDTVSRLVIAYNFLPYADTGAMVAAKRIRNQGKPVDVVTHAMDNVRKRNQSNGIIGQPFVQFVGMVEGPAYFSSSAAVSNFCRQGTRIVESWEKRGRRYSEIYSRAMWPASHFLAALHKLRHPGIVWVAEFSDPIRMTTEGEFRFAPIVVDDVFQEILDNVDESLRVTLLDNLDLFFWTEHLAYALADELLFTNTNQRLVMRAYADDSAKEFLDQKSSILPQPTLGREFYSTKRVELNLLPLVVNIGYFGEFYSTRGLNEVVEALAALPEALRRKIRIHVYTSRPELTEKQFVIANSVVAACFEFNNQLPYFEFLNALTQFDCLIVNDAVTASAHSVNPYLPSKYSDYKGSGANIWALVEQGSVLSNLEHEYMSRVGDAKGAMAILCQLVEDALGQGH